MILIDFLKLKKLKTLFFCLLQRSQIVKRKIGTSLTGLSFNSVMVLELYKDKPLFPL
ncbi:Uncharacterised protein [Suttonella ornithocola]|uniref:Uncharacterized protein n=1 Tax=Suttonella ornithocola TaxID=279832 RepID=A0A380MWD0_9GAMM|nr:Uncharacterised protein [Suttonella ornithocola]